MRQALNIPNSLTLSRIFLLPVLAILFYIHYNTLRLYVFVFCCATDFLDGYLARTCKQTTRLGQILDPISDKALVVTTILFVTGFDMISHTSLIPAGIILCREVMVSEIRSLVISGSDEFATINIAKWKTAVQMLSLSLILAYPTINNAEIAGYLHLIGEILLWLSAVIAVVSGVIYCSKHMDLIREK
ncbi:MAG: CDP-diacylglycerol--glycerol-3-phosphate 3-phosphatidyltransferase [Holosporales bacterium]|jgi:cardiolipin synthase|nr:CDP-diacylglycerol--glycerol-3-phosphate 3-phosphatidyltransferase [Holosporales bacterium]